MLWPGEEGQLFNYGSYRAPGAERYDPRLQVAQVGFHHLRTGDSNFSENLVGTILVYGNDFGNKQLIFLSKLAGNLKAMRHTVMDAYLDNSLLQGKRDQSLGDWPGDLKFLRNLLLGVTSHVIEPGGSRCQIQFLFSFCY